MFYLWSDISPILFTQQRGAFPHQQGHDPSLASHTQTLPILLNCASVQAATLLRTKPRFLKPDNIITILYDWEMSQWFQTKQILQFWCTELSNASCDESYLQSNLSSQTEEIGSSILRYQQSVLTGHRTLGQKSHRIHCLCSWYK